MVTPALLSTTSIFTSSGSSSSARLTAVTSTVLPVAASAEMLPLTPRISTVFPAATVPVHLKSGACAPAIAGRASRARRAARVRICMRSTPGSARGGAPEADVAVEAGELDAGPAIAEGEGLPVAVPAALDGQGPVRIEAPVVGVDRDGRVRLPRDTEDHVAVVAREAVAPRRREGPRPGDPPVDGVGRKIEGGDPRHLD